ncbi:MAG: oligopeptide transporter, OPT family [Eubacteriales bacterium]|nr:oligopeptide transporter, OPT family [Eubacteriales bacterium]
MSSDNKEFKPYVAADQVLPEFTVTSVIIGILLAVLFGAANAYLGLRVGLTISASIPAAVISMGIIRVIMRKDSILENNMVQTIGSAGESVAAGAIFTLPALFMWAEEGAVELPSVVTIALISLLGGVLGVLFMIPLRNALIVEEHGVLPYPEGTACSEVLLAGEEGGAKAGLVFSGLGIAAVYKFITDGLKVFPSEVAYDFKSYPGSGIGMDVLPSLLGVGYICGPKISSYMLAGGTIAWFVLMPMIYIFGSAVPELIFPAKASVAELGAAGIWSSYIRYVGAGAVACGGVISLLKSLPLIVRTFAGAMKSFGKKAAVNNRTTKDLPMNIVLIGVGLIAIALWLSPQVPVNFLGAILIVIFGFFFVTVSARMVGIVGSSNNPVSGMTIATMLVATIVLKATGNIGTKGMIAAISIGSVICIAAAIGGDTSQDLKTGFIVGATPWKQQIGEVIGVSVSAVAIGFVLYILNSAWGYGSAELPAPQAGMMKMVVEGVMEGNLPWPLIFTGIFLALVVEILQIPVLPFAVGLYLPIYLSTPMMVGGIVRLVVDKRKNVTEEERKNKVENGTLFASGMIAGEGLIGVILAIFTVVGFNTDVSGVINLGQIGACIVFALLVACFVYFINKKSKKA